jgi:hypothetical protein
MLDKMYLRVAKVVVWSKYWNERFVRQFTYENGFALAEIRSS